MDICIENTKFKDNRYINYCLVYDPKKSEILCES